MLKCPFCHFDNEDGALFCEQCKSDLGSPEPAQAVASAGTGSSSEATPFMAEPVQVVPGTAPLVEPIIGDAIPVAAFASTDPYVAPIAEVAPDVTPPPSEAFPVEPSTAPATSGAPLESLAPAATERVAATMPASAILASSGAAPASADTPPSLPPEAQPRLLVLRGQKRNVEYPVYEGLNFIGRADEKPVDIDLEDQEPPDRIWCSRQHALISFEESKLTIEDLNSANGTFVNRARIYPGQKRPLSINDVIQIGNVQLKVIV